MTRVAPLLSIAVLALATASAAISANATVTVTKNGFDPKTVTIAAGETVTWRNTDTAAHKVVFGKAPCSLTLAAGASGSCTFRAGGSFSYRDPSQGGSFKGTVTVTGPRTSVTLQSSRRAVVFAGAVTLSGVVSNQQAGEPVAVFGQECGKTSYTQLGSATTTAGGNWTFLVKPALNSNYQSHWKATQSAPVAVGVMPRLRLSRARARFTVRATAAQALTGKFVTFQRYRPARKRWVALKRVVLRSAAPPTAGSVTTSGTFRFRVRRGWRVRAFMPASQAGTCYLPGSSNVLRIR